MDVHGIRDFDTAARKVLAYLHQRLGFALWMITRTEGEDRIVLQTEAHGSGYGVEPGTVMRWADSFCIEMAKGNGPNIAPRTDIVPAYVSAPIARQVSIKAYVGFPLVREDGSLFGTLCAIDPSVQPKSIVKEQGLVELLSGMLSTILQQELKASAHARQFDQLQAETLTDPMTRLYNRRGWDQLLTSEEDRCRRYGHPAVILVLDLDKLKLVNDIQGHKAGDALIESAASALRQAARKVDIIGRLGGDEFGILSVECDFAGGKALLKRIRKTLADANINASVGLAMRDPSSGLKNAWERADQLMYQEKRTKSLVLHKVKA